MLLLVMLLLLLMLQVLVLMLLARLLHGLMGQRMTRLGLTVGIGWLAGVQGNPLCYRGECRRDGGGKLLRVVPTRLSTNGQDQGAELCPSPG